jgi:hypothetical protein
MSKQRVRTDWRAQNGTSRTIPPLGLLGLAAFGAAAGFAGDDLGVVAAELRELVVSSRVLVPAVLSSVAAFAGGLGGVSRARGGGSEGAGVLTGAATGASFC